MHKNFAEWYNTISLQPPAETLEARWKAVEAVTAGLKVKKVPDLARVFFKLPGGNMVAEDLRNAAKKEDATHVSANDDGELSVLAGGVIAQIISKSAVVQADRARTFSV